jgi:hypothetical protein
VTVLRLLSLLVLAPAFLASGIAAADAATSLNCKSASTIFGHTGGGRGGPRIERLMNVTDPAAVEALLQRYGWEDLAGEAAAVQLYRANSTRYLLMAVSARGCHLASTALEDDEARALSAE